MLATNPPIRSAYLVTFQCAIASVRRASQRPNTWLSQVLRSSIETAASRIFIDYQPLRGHIAASDASGSVNRLTPQLRVVISKSFPFHAGRSRVRTRICLGGFPSTRCTRAPFRQRDCRTFSELPMSFHNLGLSKPVLQALALKQYTSATPIQEQAIPTLLQGRDLLGIAQTGTGKTAAFMLPSIDRLAAANRIPRPTSCRMLVLAPTRELAGQIAESAARLQPLLAPVGRDRLRRFADRQAAPRPRARRRRAGRHARTPARPGRAALSDAARGRDPRPRRGRPDARPRLHPRAQADRHACFPPSGRPCSSRPPCPRRSASLPTSS